MSTVRTNNILDAAGGNTATINGMTPTAQSLQGFRNRIINGDMRIDQRNAGAAVTLSTGSLFPVDRMQAFRTGSAVATGQRSTVAPPGFTNSLLYSVTTGASVVSNDYSQLGQNIEGFNVADLGWGTANAQPVTISFWVRSSVTGTYGLGFNDNVFSRSYVTSYTVNAANTWEYKTITIPGDTTGGWTTNNTTGIRLAWDMGFGANSNTSTINSWQASGAQGLTGGVKLTQNTGATFYITGVQLEAGSVATPFERRDYGRELMMCQRYYERVSLNANTLLAMYTSAGSFYGSGVKFAVTKRATPSMPNAVSSFGAWVQPGVALYSSSTFHTFVPLFPSTDWFGYVQTRNAGNTTPPALGAFMFEADVTFVASSEL